MPTADLHGDDDEFGDDLEFAYKRGVDSRVAHGQTDGAVGRDNFEENGPELEGVLGLVLQAASFDYGDDE